MTYRQPSVMSHNFAVNPQISVPRSSFNRSFAVKTTFNAGYLVPIFVDEILPGDTVNLRTTIFTRFATLLFPLMDNIYIDTLWFFVPNRLLWDHWEEFCGYQANPGDSTSFIIPTVTSTNTTDFNELTIYDYMGIATKKSGVAINVLPLRAYYKIYNDWIRDENLQNSVTLLTDDGPDPVSTYTLLRRGKRYDYFTSSLPTPQKGSAVSLPLGTTAPVKADATFQLMPSGGTYPADARSFTMTSGNGSTGWSANNSVSTTTTIYAKGLYTDLSTATSATINQLRQSITLQQYQERAMRGGTRYVEVLKAFFGVTSPDFRLQRAELLAVHSTPLQVNTVAQTSGTGLTGQTTPIASLSAYATAVAHNNGFIKSFVEHGYVLGLVSARADLTYQDGTDRMWYNSTKYDFYWPDFAHVGEQAVLQREILTTGTASDTNVWGYVPAFDHYRYKPSKVTGLFRTNATGTLDSWTLTQDLSGGVALNSTFIQENPPTTRVKATVGDPDFLADIWHNYIHVRPLPINGIPGLRRL